MPCNEETHDLLDNGKCLKKCKPAPGGFTGQAYQRNPPKFLCSETNRFKTYKCHLKDDGLHPDFHGARYKVNGTRCGETNEYRDFKCGQKTGPEGFAGRAYQRKGTRCAETARLKEFKCTRRVNTDFYNDTQQCLKRCPARTLRRSNGRCQQIPELNRFYALIAANDFVGAAAVLRTINLMRQAIPDGQYVPTLLVSYREFKLLRDVLTERRAHAHVVSQQKQLASNRLAQIASTQLERQRQGEAEQQRRRQEDERRRQEEERRRQEEEARRQKDEEVRRQKDEEVRRQKEEEARRQKEEEARRQEEERQRRAQGSGAVQIVTEPKLLDGYDLHKRQIVRMDNMQRWKFRFVNMGADDGTNPPGCKSGRDCIIDPVCADGLPAFALIHEGTAMESLVMLPKFVGGPKKSAKKFLEEFDDLLDFDGVDSSYRTWDDGDRMKTCIDLSTHAPTAHLHNLFLHFLNDITVCTRQHPEIMHEGRPDIKKLFLMFEVFARSRNCDKIEIQDASFGVIKGVTLETQFKCLLPLKDQTYGRYNYKLTDASQQMRDPFYSRIKATPIKEFLLFQRKLTATTRMPIVTNAEPKILKALYFLGFNGVSSAPMRSEMIKDSIKPARFEILSTLDKVSDDTTLEDVGNTLFRLLLDKKLPPLTEAEKEAFNLLSARISEYILHHIAETYEETRLMDKKTKKGRRDSSSGLWYKPDDKVLNMFEKSLRNIVIDAVDRDNREDTRLYTIRYHKN